jgi:NADH-quinone oxidoreductase subunit N
VTDLFYLIVPEMVLGVAACVLFLGATFQASRNLWAAVALLGLVGAGVALCYSPLGDLSNPDLGRAVVLDRVAIFTKALALAGGAVLVLFSWNEVPDRFAAEYHACLLLIIAGLCLTGAANELVTLFLALELISIPTYVLLYLPRHDQVAQEAAAKYFLLSIFSAALVLFGFSYLYGLGGQTNIPAVIDALRVGPDRLPGMALVVLVMIVAGLGFKITAVPFHFYAPDVYQGTPTVAAAMLAFVPKAAGFVALIRVLGFVWAGQIGTGTFLGPRVPMMLYILAVVTMSLGNLLALLQDNLKRMLAYSSVAHAGYMLIGLAAAPYLQDRGEMTHGVDAVLFYLVAYGAMTIGAFAVLAYLSRPERPVETVDDLAGLSVSHPGVALLMGLFLFSLIGIPPTAGFWAKLLVIAGALGATPEGSDPQLYRILALVAVLNAAVGAWYYLRVLAVMYLRTPIRPLPRTRSWPGLATLWLCAIVTLGLAYPRPLTQLTQRAVAPTAQVVAQRAER